MKDLHPWSVQHNLPPPLHFIPQAEAAVLVQQGGELGAGPGQRDEFGQPCHHHLQGKGERTLKTEFVWGKEGWSGHGGDAQGRRISFTK
jgi:hypothetical protein